MEQKELNKGYQIQKRIFLVLIIVCTVFINSVQGESEIAVAYEDDSLYQESPPRNEQAIHAMLLDGEKAIRRYFEFPKDTLDEPHSIFGIDVSHHNGEIKWDSFPSNNVVVAIAKATEGTHFADKRFKEHWTDLKRLKDVSMASGNPRFFRGAYHFFTPSDPNAQARDFIKAVGELEAGDLPPTLDIEWTSFNNDRWKKYSGSEIAQRALTWLRVVEKHYGRKPIIYTNSAWWNGRGINDAELARYPLWIASYGRKSINDAKPNRLPSSFDNWFLWQFTDLGYFKGNPKKRFDVNRLNGGIEKLYSLVGLSDGKIPLRKGIEAPRRVKWLQDRLVALGYMDMQTIGSGYGIFGSLTDTAIKEFQGQIGLDDTGILDDVTETSLALIKVGAKRGDVDPVISLLNKRLAAYGYLPALPPDSSVLTVDSVAALERFQQAVGISATGVFDEAGYRKLREGSFPKTQFSDPYYMQMTKHSQTGVPENCAFDFITDAVVMKGKRRLALVVGVSEFLAKEDITPLKYTAKDARAFADLLISDYGYPKQNVCVLINEEATIANVRRYFRKLADLIEDAPPTSSSEEKDVVVFYASTHGSQVTNHPQDQAGSDHEISGKDSTLLLYDSWVEGTWDLVDDEMYELIGKVLKKTPNVAMVLDACHSGSMTKGLGRFKAITYRPPEFQESKPSGHNAFEDDVRKKLVYLGAAQDDQVARELDSLGHSIFTEALLRVSKPVPDKPLTYAKLKAQIAYDLRINKRAQIPVLTGPGDLVAFGSAIRIRPGNMLIVDEITPRLRLVGEPMPGLGLGALFSVFNDDVTAAEARDPNRVKALLKVVSYTEGEALAEVVGKPKKDGGILEVGDVAVMIQPSDAYRALRVRFRPETEPNGLPNSLVAKVSGKVRELSRDAIGLIQIVGEEPEFTVELVPEREAGALDADGRRRIIIRGTTLDRDFLIDQDKSEGSTVDTVVAKLTNLNLQKKYLTMKGYGGGEFEDNSTLQVSIVESAKMLPEEYRRLIEASGVKCQDGLLKPIKDMNGFSYRVPLCALYRVKVTYKKMASQDSLNPKPLYIGLVTLGSSGANKGYPAGAQEARLEPGDTLYFPLDGTGFAAAPPLGAEDVFVVIGTQDKRPWRRIGVNAKEIIEVASNEPLEMVLRPWTMTRVPVKLFDPNSKIFEVETNH